MARAQTVITWGNAGTSDFTMGSSWSGGVAPGAIDTGQFTAATPAVQPTLGTNYSVGGIRFASGAGSFTLSGGGTLALGNLGIDNQSVMPQTVATPLAFGTASSSITSSGPLTISGAIANNTSGGLTLNGSGVSGVVSGAISGSGVVIKAGTGQWTLSGSNSYAGVTTVSAGILRVTNLSALGSTAGGTVVAPGATLNLNFTQMNTGLTVVGEALTLGGTGMSGQGALTSNGSAGWSGPLTLSSNTAIGVLGPGGMPPAVLTLDGAIGESGGPFSLTKIGFARLSLSGINTYTGGTIINQGSLAATVSGALPVGRDVVVNSTSGGQVTLDLFGSSQSIGTLTLGGAGGSNFGSSHVILGTSGTLTLGGPVTFDAANNPFGATIAGSSTFDSPNPFGGTLALGSATRTFAIGDSGNSPNDLTIFSNITGSAGAGILKTGTGTLLLAGQSTFAGGVIVDVNSGTLLLGSSSSIGGSGPVGTGTLTMRSGTTLGAGGVFTNSGSFYDDRTIANAVLLSSNVTLGAGDYLQLTLAGAVTAADLATTLHLGESGGLFISGPLGAANSGTAITFDSGTRADRGGVALLGPVDGASVAGAGRITSLTADHAAIVFSSGAIPAPAGSTLAVRSLNNGYIGLVAPGRTSDLLARISGGDRTTFSGTFGFDTLESTSIFTPNNFTENLDFTGFGGNFTIGSLSAAILSGTITPPSTGYAFGNGGGVLLVRSNLGGGFGVKVDSVGTIPENALTTIFQGNNTYTGNLTVTNSLAILDSPLALPAGRSFSLGLDGYMGYTENFSSGPGSNPIGFAGFVSRLSGFTPSSVLGFDSRGYIADNFSGTGGNYSYGARHVFETVDLRSLGSIYLGSSTRAVLFGPVLAPNNGGTLSLMGARDGHLVIASPLVMGNVTSVVVGSGSTPLGTGTVELAGRNTYAGGTLLLSGVLLLDGSSEFSRTGTFVAGPLGTGPLTIGALAQLPTLASNTNDDTVIQNGIVLGSALQLGSEYAYYGGGTQAAYAGAGYPQLILNGVISDLDTANRGSLGIFSDTVLNGANSFTGGVNLHQGSLALGRDTALGTGTLTISPRGYSQSGTPVSLLVAGGSRTIVNNVIVDAFGSDAIGIGGRGSLTINGGVTLGSSSMFQLGNYPMYINGPVSGFGQLRVGGKNALVLGGTNTYTGGTRAEQGAIIFGTPGAMPPTGPVSASYSGYVGTAVNYGASFQSSFISRFDRASMSGTIGLDSPAGPPQVFTGNIDFTGFNPNVRLGSASSAIFSGAITPQDTNYHFGGGGGSLEVNSTLAVARSVHVVSSFYDPLTVRFTGPNTFAGGTFVQESAAIFTPGALPAGTDNFTLTSGGYIGLQLSGSVNGITDATITSFLAHFPVGTAQGFLGFDAGGSIVTDLDLSRFTTPGLGLATTSNLTIAGNLTLASGNTAYRFAGFKGGQLTIASTLSDSGATMRSVRIGEVNLPATFGNPIAPSGPLSSVTLSGNNTYTGGTTLAAGELRLGSNTALGTGAVTVPALIGDETWRPGLFATGGSRTMANNLSVGSALNIGGDSYLTLSGNVSGSGELYKVGVSVLTLSGNNSAFAGGIYVAQGNVTFASATAAGTGPIRLGTPSSPSVTFLVSMLVNGISGDNAVDQIILGTGTVLTVNQTFNAEYLGQISSNSGSASVVYQGPVASAPTRLRLGGPGSYNGSTSINSGIVVVAGDANAFGPGSNSANAISINGGKLALESGILLSNPLTLNTGTLGGVGVLTPPATLRVGGTAGSRMVLAPGLGTAGILSFTNGILGATPVLSLDNGGVYNWQLLDAAAGTGEWDILKVTGTVNLAATDSANPFTLRILPIAGLDLMSAAVNFNPNQSYSWNVLDATSIAGFAGSSLAIDSSAMSGLTNGGTFSFSLNGASTSLLLNFSPAAIPEPSTYALLGLGALIVGFAARRRKR